MGLPVMANLKNCTLLSYWNFQMTADLHSNVKTECCESNWKGELWLTFLNFKEIQWSCDLCWVSIHTWVFGTWLQSVFWLPNLKTDDARTVLQHRRGGQITFGTHSSSLRTRKRNAELPWESRRQEAFSTVPSKWHLTRDQEIPADRNHGYPRRVLKGSLRLELLTKGGWPCGKIWLPASRPYSSSQVRRRKVCDHMHSDYSGQTHSWLGTESWSTRAPLWSPAGGLVLVPPLPISVNEFSPWKYFTKEVSDGFSAQFYCHTWAICIVYCPLYLLSSHRG